MLIEKELLSFKKKFDKRLKKLFNEKKKDAKKISPWAEKFVNDFADHATDGGKRLRPALMYFSYLASGGRDKEAIINASLSPELLHIGFLIQDDIIDRDSLRHGRETMHWHYRKWAEKNLDLSETNNAHYGISQAICIADFGFEMAFKVLADSVFDEKLKMRAVNRLSKVVFSTAIGEMSDVLAEDLRSATEEQVLNILEYKTAHYTVCGPLSMGAILAGRSSGYLEKLCDYAVPLGIAFQIRDDILGMFGDSLVTGKPVGADLKEGKMTLLIVQALKKTKPRQKSIILKSLGDHNCSEKRVDEVRDIIKETGSLAYSESLAEKFVLDSKKALARMPIPSASKEIFSGIADFVVKRNK